MAIPKNKAELLEAILENYQLLKKELVSISIQLTNKKELEGHAKNTVMSINDLVAYLLGWGQLVLKWNRNRSNGLEVDFPETGFKWNELGQLAQKFYDDYKNDDFTTLTKKLDRTVNDIIKLVESRSNKELYGTPWYDKWTLGRMVQLNTSSPYKNARARIRKWKKAKSL